MTLLRDSNQYVWRIKSVKAERFYLSWIGAAVFGLAAAPAALYEKTEYHDR